MEEKLFWLGFSLFPGVGPLRFARLLAYFGTAKDAWYASRDDLLASRLGDKLTAQFIEFRTKHSLDGYEKSLQKKSISYHLLSDTTYPKQLATIPNPPFVLYTKSLKPFDFNVPTNTKTIGVVGTRKVTSYGTQVTEQFTTELVQAGCVIVSGLALGVDGIAHKSTLDNDGVTIAVLGCGVDCCTPREHQVLYNEILQKNGVIVSEFPPGQPPSIGSFPSRNRIVAGLSLGILVTEGAADSGSLITASDALKQGRKVFAVPGPITSALSKGPNSLIGKGGQMVMSAQDILGELCLVSGHNPPSLKLRSLARHSFSDGARAKGDTPEEQRIIDVLTEQHLHIDELVRKTDMSSSQLSGILTIMEMKGMIQSLDAGYFGLTI